MAYRYNPRPDDEVYGNNRRYPVVTIPVQPAVDDNRNTATAGSVGGGGNIKPPPTPIEEAGPVSTSKDTDTDQNKGANTNTGKGGYGKGNSAGGGYSYTGPGYAPMDIPEYVSKYQQQIDDLTAAILGREAFSYDHEKDPTYQQYEKQYTRQGNRAMEDVLGQLASRTGGLASSYATGAAQQTYNNYMAELAGVIPELRQLAYSMYVDEGDRMMDNLSILQGLEKTNYGIYRDQVSDYIDEYNSGLAAYERQQSAAKAAAKAAAESAATATATDADTINAWVDAGLIDEETAADWYMKLAGITPVTEQKKTHSQGGR